MVRMELVSAQFELRGVRFFGKERQKELRRKTYAESFVCQPPGINVLRSHACCHHQCLRRGCQQSIKQAGWTWLDGRLIRSCFTVAGIGDERAELPGGGHGPRRNPAAASTEQSSDD